MSLVTNELRDYWEGVAWLSFAADSPSHLDLGGKNEDNGEVIARRFSAVIIIL